MSLVGAVVCLLLTGAVSRAGDAFQEDVAFQASVDDSTQQYVIIYPKDFSPEQSHSLLVVLHGHGSDRWQFVRDPRAEARAARDVAARHAMLYLSPDYRAKTSWMGPRAEADLVQILKTMRAKHTIDRVILCGGSMGGTAVLTFTALHPEMVDGVVSLNGTANLVEYPNFSDAIAESFGGTRTEIPDEYRKRSAEFTPEKFTMPIAATTGGQDRSVPPESVLRLMSAIEKKNKRTLLLHRPQGGHSTSYDDTIAALEFVLKATSARAPNSRAEPPVQTNDR